jgi:hypothetical protein
MLSLVDPLSACGGKRVSTFSACAENHLLAQPNNKNIPSIELLSQIP